MIMKTSNETQQTQSVLMKYYYEIFEIQSKSNSSNFIFRGQADKQWDIASGAKRRIKSSEETNANYTSEENKYRYINYHEKLLERARKYSFDKELTELELLATIQHFGGATCLIDFTTNFFVALWFASSTSYYIDKNQKRQEADGCIFIINRQSMEDNNTYITLKYSDIDIFKLINSTEKASTNYKTLYLWSPKNINNRVYHQDSIFVFGYPEITKKDCYSIIIDKKDKINIRRELKMFFKIDTETIFSDIHGFASNSNSYSTPLEDYSHLNCYEIARNYIEENTLNGLNNAISYINRTLKCNSDRAFCRNDQKKCIDYLPKDEVLYILAQCYQKVYETMCAKRTDETEDKENTLNNLEQIYLVKAKEIYRTILDQYKDNYKSKKIDQKLFTNTTFELTGLLYDDEEESSLEEAIERFEALKKVCPLMEYYSTYSIIELTILLGKEEKFKQSISKIKRSNDNNQYYLSLKKFFIAFGNAFFRNDIDNKLQEGISNTPLTPIKHNIILYFEDLKKIVSKKINDITTKTYLYDLISKIEKYQEDCLNINM